MRLSFRFADLSDVDELLHERLVLRCEANLILTYHVTATIPNLHEIQVVAAYGRAGERRAHTRAARVFLALEVDGGVGVMRRALQALDQIEIRIANGVTLANQHLAH